MVVVRSDWFEWPEVVQSHCGKIADFSLYFRLGEILLCVSAKQMPSLERKWKYAEEMKGKSHGFLAA